MQTFPRIAIGSIQEHADHRLVSWGVMALLSRLGLDVQPYHPQSAFNLSAATTATGRDPRHLDPWQMGRATCVELLAGNADDCDLAVLEGRFQPGTNLDKLCRWLAVPRVAVVDVSLLQECQTDFRLLRGFDGVILDRVEDAQSAARWTVDIETVSRSRVLAWLPARLAARECFDAPMGEAPSLRWCDTIAKELSQRLRTDRLLDIARAAPVLPEAAVVRRTREASTIALAFDEAFRCYFPDTLDRMEAAGCRIRTFSPLRDGTLPPDADVVVLGCGPLARHAERLSANRCLHEALAAHKRMGKRIYAEGAGAAYLCREVLLADGARHAMSGLLPACARECRCAAMQPVETRWRSPLWLGVDESPVRGYRNSGWSFTNDPYECRCDVDCDRVIDTVTDANVIGTRVHVNFAAHPSLLADFVHPLQHAARVGV